MIFRALFFGSPAFAVPSLEALHAIADVAGVVCQPDKPAGRGLALTAPPVKTRAAELGVPVAQPTKIRTGEFAAWVRAQEVDVALVVAYGRILPIDVLSGARLGCVNVHASLLPKYRGAAPIAWAIVNGEGSTGITLMRLDEARASAAPMLDKEHGRIDWSKRAPQVHDHVRGMSPWPGAFTTSRGRSVKVHATRVVSGTRAGMRPAEVVVADKSRVLVACGADCVELVTVQPEGKRAMAASDWAMGRGVSEGDLLGH